MATTEADLKTRIAGAVKAELARRGLSGNDLVGPLSLGRNAVYSRLKAEQPFDVEELELIAAHLDISIDALLASAELGRAVA